MTLVVEDFAVDSDSITRIVSVGKRRSASVIRATQLKQLLENQAMGSERLLWELLELRGYVPQRMDEPSSRVGIVDLCCGCGGLSLGAKRAVEALGLEARFVAAADVDATALAVHSSNFATERTLHTNIEDLVDYQISGHREEADFAYPPEMLDDRIRRIAPQINLVTAGPPCQGHSNLNNHSRRNHPRNQLYLTVPAFAVAVSAQMVLIENVPEVLNDKTNIVTTTESLLHRRGYRTEQVVLRSDKLGVAQTRRRHFFLATKSGTLAVKDNVHAFLTPVPSVDWAIGDLDEPTGKRVFYTPTEVSEENGRRINVLFDNEIYDLPEDVRPDCHKSGHTYPSVYGRMRPGEPAQTITTGFTRPGRGRFIHPVQRRTITPHEAARLQSFPDYFHFETSTHGELSRSDYAKLIGDAVPPRLGYVAALCMLAGYLGDR